MNDRSAFRAFLLRLPFTLLLGAALSVPVPGLPAMPAVAAVTPPDPASAVPAPVAPAGRFRWPLEGPPRLVRRFDPPPQPWRSGHRGVDLAAQPGAVVRAAGGGVVLFAGMIAGRPVVSVAHGQGLRTTYEPVDPRVRTGDRIAVGDPLGVLAAGHPGCPAPACLHWGLRQGERYLDPLTLVGWGPVRLLPWAG